MAISAWDGPVVGYGGSQATTGEYNPQRGPQMFDLGYALLDPRQPFTYVPGQKETQPFYGWYSCDYSVIDATPSAIADNNIAASQTPGAAVRTITLVSASGAGITVSTSITNASTGATVTGLLAIDSKMVPVTFGDSASVSIWDPAKAIARAVRITSGGNDSGITFTVAGYDLYGYPMTETITGANAGIATGKKAWKYISGITCSGDVATTVKVGTSDIYGLPLRVDRFGNTQIWWNDTSITANTGFTAAVTTSPATATTGDVRGTYAVQSASDGTKTLQIRIAIQPGTVSAMSTAPFATTGLLGVTQA